MVGEKQVWHTQNEGNLARSWEQRLKPRVAPREQRRRQAAAWIRPALWIAWLWAAALVPSILAIHVMTMSYQYDQLNQQYANLTRQNQVLVATVASKTSASAFAKDAARLKVQVEAPRVDPVKKAKVSRRVSARAVSPVEQVTLWIRQLSRSLTQPTAPS